MKRLWIVQVSLWLLIAGIAAATPQLTLPDVAGSSHPLTEFIGRGQWTVVTVWSVDCPICRRETPTLAFFHDEHKRKDATVLGISVDGAAERTRVRDFIDSYRLGFPNLIATRADIARFGGGPYQGTPTYLIFSPDGRLIARRLGATSLDEIERTISSGSANHRVLPKPGTS